MFDLAQVLRKGQLKGFLVGSTQRTKFLAWVILHSGLCPSSFKLGFIWYRQCLIWFKFFERANLRGFWRPLCSGQSFLHGPFYTLGDVLVHLNLVLSGTSNVWSSPNFWTLFGLLATLMQRTIFLAWAILHSGGCTCSFKPGFNWYLQCLI